MANTGKSLKAQNLPWICAALALDIALLVATVCLEYLGEWPTKAMAARFALTTFLPIVALLLIAIIPVELKDTLTYWRVTEVLPGHRAFTVYGPKDSRIDMVALEKTAGPLPNEPKEQNTFWYALYKKVGSEVSVVESHKLSLLFRELAALSFSLLVMVPIGLYFVFPQAALPAFALFLIQYLLCALAGRNSGIRFVTNVLVLHSSTDPKKSIVKRTSKTKSSTVESERSSQQNP